MSRVKQGNRVPAKKCGVVKMAVKSVARSRVGPN